MLRMFRPEVQALKKVFHSLPYALYSITVSNPYEEIVYIINTFFEINKENFEILSFGNQETNSDYCEEKKMLKETLISIKCKPKISTPLDEVFKHYCGDFKNNENQEKLFNQFKENFNKAIEKDEMERDALLFDIYIREFNYVDHEGKKFKINLVEFNYISKIRTNLFKIVYEKMKELFIYKIKNLKNSEQYKINYDGEVFEEVRIQCLLPFILINKNN